MCFDTFNAHLGEVTRILVSPDGRYVFSAGADGSIFVYSVTEYANDQTIVKQEMNASNVKDEQLRLEMADPKNGFNQLQLVVDE